MGNPFNLKDANDVLAASLGALFFGLLLVHMAKPRYINREMSSAKFFGDLPKPKTEKPRFRLGSPMDSLPFRVQALAFAMLALALVFSRTFWGGGDERGFGIWVWVDTSASMTTIEGDGTRFDQVKTELREVLDEARRNRGVERLCLRLSTFDSVRRDWVVDGSIEEVMAAVQDLEPRALATNLEIIRSGLDQHSSLSPAESSSDGDQACPITHWVVLSDMPAPTWLDRINSVQIIWRHLGTPTANLGLTAIRPALDPLTGVVSQIEVELSAYGAIPDESLLEVTNDKGETVYQARPNWATGPIWQARFKPPPGGSLTLNVTPGGAYTFDDQATINLEQGEALHVDWQLQDQSLRRTLSWVQNDQSPRFRVTSQFNPNDATPQLWVGSGYRPGAGLDPIQDFLESDLLADLNLDVAERIGMTAMPEIEGFDPILRGSNGQAWIALRRNPLVVYVPGLPIDGPRELEAFSNTVFFNAVKTLLNAQPPPPLFTTTDETHPLPEGNRIALHVGEGNTMRAIRSFGEMDGLKPVRLQGQGRPIWPLFLLAMVVFWAVERFYAFRGSARWA